MLWFDGLVWIITLGLGMAPGEYSSWNTNPSRLKFQTVRKVCENSVWLTNFHSVNHRGPIKIGSVFCSLQPRLLFVFRWMNLTDLALNLRVGKYEPQTHNSYVFVEILEREKNVCAK